MKIFRNLAVVLSVGALTACSGEVAIDGAWVEPVPGMSEMQQGFILGADGVASSINMATLKYEKWERQGDKLLLSGKSIGNHQIIEFTDTLMIEKATADSLILKRGALLMKYSKIGDSTTDDVIPAVALVPAKKIESVKGVLTIGHEVRSFVAEGDTTAYWIVDESGELTQKYDEVTNGVKNGTPVYVELGIVDEGKSEEGFAADYAGVYRVVRVDSVASK